ncbi:MAG TPA: type 4a pilus biogenesis protein PilO [Lacunisphaera sp.]|nr:type 4a pilus biogenesis protein PilO [Lacunisphaera sp.]
MMILLTQFWAAVRLRPVMSACLAVALLAGIANYPLWQQRQEAARRHAEVRQKGETILMALRESGRIQADLAVLTEAQEIIDRNLASDQTMEVNLGYFYRLEKLSRVRLVRVDQLGAPAIDAKSPFTVVPISLQVSGTYRNLLGFMRELENGPRILRTRSYRLERTDVTGGELMLVMSVELLARP